MSNKAFFVMMALLILSVAVVVERSTINELESKSDNSESLEVLLDQKNKTIDSLKKVADSLYDQNFPCQIELGRYQTAYSIFVERDPQGAKIFGTIISNETE